uniref:Transient receptor potential cation channel subfamily A member 1-like n=1 Tax=Octopus vulgaris TaxID=6645 RepID=A0A6C0PP95_OCTVU|nr:transient receptor potential cation channel subfamily A member 1-like [Octopus vulgaris]
MSRLRSAMKAVNFLSPKTKKCIPVPEKAKENEESQVCMMNASPYYICKLASKGDLTSFEKYFNKNPDRLHTRNTKRQTVLHLAAEKGHEDILLFSLANGAEIDAEDNKGCTPLHVAIMNQFPKCVNILLKYGCNPHIYNLQEQNAIQLACELDFDDVLLVLLKYKSIDVNAWNKDGNTPLHCTASKDSYKCAKILLENGSLLCQTCEIGFYPIHTAALSGSAKTLNVFFEFVSDQGKDLSRALSYVDKDNNVPLHSAVRSGSLEVVRVCLEAGSRIDLKQDDLYNPLHLASAQGNLDMVSLMSELQEESFMKALRQKDILEMTPLHRATLFNHGHIIEFLISKGADLEIGDIYQRTPLLLAASKGSHEAGNLLCRAGANPLAKDVNSRNVLHLAIKGGAVASKMVCSESYGNVHVTIKQLTNEKDAFGCTALHYASQEGRLAALNDLLRSGASINSKNNDRASPFHFAVRYGRYKSCCKLLDSIQGKNILNETDGKGMSAMHIAAENGHVKILDLLITRGAVVSKDNRNNSPLHHAAANGYTKSITLLLNVHCYLMNATNVDGETALHLSAKNGHTTAVCLLLSCKAKILKDRKKMTFYDHILEMKSFEVAQAVIEHQRWEEIMAQPSEIYGQTIVGLVRELPDVCLSLMDRCTTPSKEDPKCKKFSIEYNFKYLQSPEDDSGDFERKPMTILNEMVKYGRVDCLCHPLTINYLSMKWMAYGLPISLTSYFFYIIYMVSLSIFALTNKQIEKNSTSFSYETFHHNHQNYFLSTIIVAYSLINIVRAIVQLIQQRLNHLFEGSVVLELFLHVLTLIFICPFLIDTKFDSFQWEAGIFAIFIAWFNSLLYLQRFESTGIYVVMFLEILFTLLKVLVVFFSLFIAFGLAFYLSMSSQSEAYEQIFPSVLKSLMMMLELDYSTTFHTLFLNNTIDYKSVYVILILYVILMPFLLMNLLIGLAVGDIESIQKNAGLKRLTMQVTSHTAIERMLPKRLLRRFNKETYTVFPNDQGKCSSSIMKQSQPSNNDKFQNIEISADKIDWEMRKQNQRLKSIQSMMESQQEMIRMITQKMEICSEDDFVDEGENFTECMGNDLSNGENQVKRWKSFVEKKVKK